MCSRCCLLLCQIVVVFFALVQAHCCVVLLLQGMGVMPRHTTQTNRALTLSKMDDHQAVIAVCCDALLLDPDNEKARFRRGVARMKVGEYESAHADLSAGVKAGNKDAVKALKECNKLRTDAGSSLALSPKPRPFEGIFNRPSPDTKGLGALSLHDSTFVQGTGGKTACPYGGLKNEGATCYLNSVLQTVFHIPKLRRAILSTPSVVAKKGEQMSVVLALQRLFCRLEMAGAAKATSAANPASIVELLASFGWEADDTLMQHDIGEFLLKFFEEIDDNMKAHAHLAKLRIPALFGIKKQVIDTIRSPKNDAEKAWVRHRTTGGGGELDWPLVVHQIKEYNSITAVCQAGLDPEVIEDYNTSSDYEDLERELKVAQEKGDMMRIDGVKAKLKEKIESPEGKGFGKKDIESRSMFTLLPPILMVHLQRNDYCPMRGAIKDNSRFEFEEYLDLTSCCAEGSFDPAHPPKYRLFSVIVHSGFTQVGHYYCFLRPGMGSKDAPWIKFNDDVVGPCSAQEAIEANFGGEVGAGRLRSAYFLCYIRESDMAETLDTQDLAVPRHVVESMRDGGLTTLPQSVCVLLSRGFGAVGIDKGSKSASTSESKARMLPDASRLRGTQVHVAVPDMQTCTIQELVQQVRDTCKRAGHRGLERPNKEELYAGYFPPSYEEVVDNEGAPHTRAVIEDVDDVGGGGNREYEPELLLCLTILRNHEIQHPIYPVEESEMLLSRLNTQYMMRLEWIDISEKAVYTSVCHVMETPTGYTRHGDPFMIIAYKGESVARIKRRLALTMGWDVAQVLQWDFVWHCRRDDGSYSPSWYHVDDADALVDFDQVSSSLCHMLAFPLICSHMRTGISAGKLQIVGGA